MGFLAIWSKREQREGQKAAMNTDTMASSEAANSDGREVDSELKVHVIGRFRVGVGREEYVGITSACRIVRPFPSAKHPWWKSGALKLKHCYGMTVVKTHRGALQFEEDVVVEKNVRDHGFTALEKLKFDEYCEVVQSNSDWPERGLFSKLENEKLSDVTLGDAIHHEFFGEKLDWVEYYIEDDEDSDDEGCGFQSVGVVHLQMGTAAELRKRHGKQRLIIHEGSERMLNE